MKAYIVCIGHRPISCQLVDYKSALNWQRDFEKSISHNPLTENHYRIMEVEKTLERIATCDLNGNIHFQE